VRKSEQRLVCHSPFSAILTLAGPAYITHSPPMRRPSALKTMMKNLAASYPYTLCVSIDRKCQAVVREHLILAETAERHAQDQGEPETH